MKSRCIQDKSPISNTIKKIHKRVSLLIRLLISLSIISYLLWHVDFGRLGSILAGINTIKLLAASLLLTISLHISLLAFKSLIDKQERARIPKYRFSRCFYLANLIALFLPGRIGEFSIAIMLKPYVDSSKMLGISVLDKAISIISFVALGSIALLLNDRKLDSILILTLFGITFVLFLVILLGQMVKPDAGSLYARSLRKLISVIPKVPIKLLIINLVLKLLRFFIITLAIWQIIDAIGTQVPLLPLITSVATVHLSSVFPISIQGIGVNEAIYAYWLKPFGVTLELALAFSFTIRIIATVASICAYLISEALTNIKLRSNTGID